MKHYLILLAGFLASSLNGADFVITISIDGLGSSYMQALIGAGQLPHLARFTREAAGTPNARADHDITVTLPNHISMITSRPITGPAGHNWIHNTDPANGVTLHSQKGAYIASAFDVAHDNGRRTGLWATKTKFSLFSVSYDAVQGAADTTGPDNGRNKLDLFVVNKSSGKLTDLFMATMTNNPCHYAFVHFGEADGAGHQHGWGSESYNQALIDIDRCLGRIRDVIATDPVLKDRTALIITADHGGTGKNHSEAGAPLNYTIPFYIWGTGVTPGDLYTLNTGTRICPGNRRPDYTTANQPVRNSEAGNLALSLLGLGPVPGSSINLNQELKR